VTRQWGRGVGGAWSGGNGPRMADAGDAACARACTAQSKHGDDG
jgi:hypothetical protein